jgi:hypothetical protein
VSVTPDLLTQLLTKLTGSNGIGHGGHGAPLHVLADEEVDA